MNLITEFAIWLAGANPTGSAKSSITFNTEQINEAKTLIDSWLTEKGNTNAAWHYNRSDFAARLKDLLSSHKLDQGCLDSCAFTSLLFACMRCYPVKTARWAMSIFDTGGGNLGGLNTPTNAVLRNKLPSDLLSDNPSDSTKPKYPEFTDWILQTAIVSAYRDKNGFIYSGRRSENGDISMRISGINEETGSIFNLCHDFFGAPVIDSYEGESFSVNTKLAEKYAVILVIPAKFMFPSATSTHVVYLDSKFIFYKDDYNRLANQDWIGCKVHSYGKRELLQIVKNTRITNGDGFDRIIYLKVKEF